MKQLQKVQIKIKKIITDQVFKLIDIIDQKHAGLVQNAIENRQDCGILILRETFFSLRPNPLVGLDCGV